MTSDQIAKELDLLWSDLAATKCDCLFHEAETCSHTVRSVRNAFTSSVSSTSGGLLRVNDWNRRVQCVFSVFGEELPIWSRIAWYCSRQEAVRGSSVSPRERCIARDGALLPVTSLCGTSAAAPRLGCVTATMKVV